MTSKFLRLGVNVDHVATIRNARGGRHPDPVRAAKLAIAAGCDGITAQYEGGPSYMPQWTWPFNGLLVSSDPVALDTVGWRIIERKRAEQGMRPLREDKREPAYIATAADAQHRIGTNDPARIDRVEI